MADREARLHDAISAVLPALADLHVTLRSPGPVDRDELAADVATAATILKRARDGADPKPVGGQTAYLSRRCKCGHPRSLHSPHVDPAEPCTAGDDGFGEACQCERFKAADDG